MKKMMIIYFLVMVAIALTYLCMVWVLMRVNQRRHERRIDEGPPSTTVKASTADVFVDRPEAADLLPSARN